MTHETEIHRAPEDTFDRVLCTELFWQAPPELTQQLVHLAQTYSTPVASRPVRPQTWYTTLVTLLTAMAAGLSFIVAWQFYAILGSGLGMNELWMQVQVALNNGLVWLGTEVPFMPYVLNLLAGIGNYAHWLLVAVVLWLALDGWAPRVSVQQQQQASG